MVLSAALVIGDQEALLELTDQVLSMERREHESALEDKGRTCKEWVTQSLANWACAAHRFTTALIKPQGLQAHCHIPGGWPTDTAG